MTRLDFFMCATLRMQSRHMYESAMSNMRMSHVTRMNGSCHTVADAVMHCRTVVDANMSRHIFNSHELF